MYETLWDHTLVVQLRVMGDSAPPIPIAEFFTVITKNVNKRISQMKRSAAGLDGITSRDVSHPATQVVLQLLFNLHMVGRQPSSWGMNRTTLLPKDGKDLYLVTNFSPITICSILSQVLGALLIQRSAKWSCSQPERMVSKVLLMSSMTATRAGCLSYDCCRSSLKMCTLLKHPVSDMNPFCLGLKCTTVRTLLSIMPQ